jgi:pyruvate dehydrogenase E2 component (dihydrolipoamide acetyltransferase)
MSEVLMPRLSDSMEEGTILKWLKSAGEQVARGDELVEVETDKATMTYEADAAGFLHPVAREGDTLPVGAVIAHLLADASEAPPEGGGLAPGGTSVGADGGRPSNGAGPSSGAAPGRGGASGAGAASGGDASPGDIALAMAADTSARPKASPLARRIARERGLELATMVGSGPGGRIVRADVEAAAVAAPAAAPAPVTPQPSAPVEAGTAKGDVTVVELTRMQQVVARRMAESKATVPEFTLSTEVDMERCVELRAELKAVADGGGAPSYNDMVLKACGLALREFPRANGSYRDGRFELYGRVNVGMAVAAQDALVVPTVFDADSRSLGEIGRSTRALVGRVRSGEITPPELSGGTFTVSNLGMYGVTEFTAVINPPQAAILAVGAMVQRPVVHEGEIGARHIMSITLACDHRILYGADAAEFLARIRALLEQPLALLL